MTGCSELPRFCGSAPTLPSRVTLFIPTSKIKKFVLRNSVIGNFYILFVKRGRKNHAC